MKTGMHSKMRTTIGDFYLTIAEEIFKQPLEPLRTVYFGRVNT